MGGCTSEGSKAYIRVYGSERYLSALRNALEPEKDVGKRYTVDIVLENGVLTIVINYEDMSALRAALNTYLRLLALAAPLYKRFS